MLTDAAAASTDAGLRVEIAPVPASVCEGGDVAGQATAAKNRATVNEFHLVDDRGAAWMWDVWIGPAIAGR